MAEMAGLEELFGHDVPNLNYSIILTISQLGKSA